ncbi:MAG: hypothetical protein WCE26_14110 [Candidatus Acidiferrales bacterium]
MNSHVRTFWMFVLRQLLDYLKKQQWEPEDRRAEELRVSWLPGDSPQTAS